MTRTIPVSPGTGPAAGPEATRALRAQCLATGQAGAALLPIEQARNGTGTWPHARAAIAAVTTHPMIAAPAASLYLGAPAVAFTLHTADGGSGRYARAPCASSTSAPRPSPASGFRTPRTGSAPGSARSPASTTCSTA